jgi:hypothetical protein
MQVGNGASGASNPTINFRTHRTLRSYDNVIVTATVGACDGFRQSRRIQMFLKRTGLP